jgi:hypothetical protein
MTTEALDLIPVFCIYAAALVPLFCGSAFPQVRRLPRTPPNHIPLWKQKWLAFSPLIVQLTSLLKP